MPLRLLKNNTATSRRTTLQIHTVLRLGILYPFLLFGGVLRRIRRVIFVIGSVREILTGAIFFLLLRANAGLPKASCRAIG